MAGKRWRFWREEGLLAAGWFRVGEEGGREAGRFMSWDGVVVGLDGRAGRFMSWDDVVLGLDGGLWPWIEWAVVGLNSNVDLGFFKKR